MPEPRIFKIDSPHMKGEDVETWQREIKIEFDKLDINCPIKADGVYGVTTRAYTASLCHALGMTAGDVMADGVTPELRIRIRNRRLTPSENLNFNARITWRRNLRERYGDGIEINVHRPVSKILEDSWGYHKGVHDGIDVICPADAILFAMVKSKVIDVRTGGWWGKAPSGEVAKGDGIIQLEIFETVGPFVKGHHIGYGHAEKPMVRKNQIVPAGKPIGHAGKAVAWHIHLMYNNGDTLKGIGTIDPRKILDYSIRHG